MALNDFEYYDPAAVLYIRQLRAIKYTQGCGACSKRDRRVQLGNLYLCGINSNEPDRVSTQGARFCNKWQHDEGVEYGCEK